MRPIERMIDYVENRHPAAVSVCLFLVSFALREVLELRVFPTVDNLNAPTVLFHFTYYSFSMIFLSALVGALTRTPFFKAFRTVLFFYPVILLSTLIDGFLLHGNTDYQFLSGDIVAVLTGGPQYFLADNPGQPLGLKIEVAAMLLMLAAYLWAKIGSLLRTAASFLVVYVLFFLFIAGTSVVGLGQNSLIMVASGNRVWEHTYFLICAEMAMITAAAVWFAANRNQFLAVVRNLRPTRLAGFLLFAAAGFLIRRGFQPFDLLTALLAVTFLWLSSVVTNDIADVGIDRRTNRGRPLVRGIITVREYWMVAAASALIAAAFSYVINPLALGLCAAILLLGLAYSFKPIRFRRYPFSTVMSGLGAGVAFLIGYMAATFSADIGESAIRFFAAIVVSTTLGYNVKDIKDMKGDKAEGVSTLLTVLGERRGKQAVALLLLASYPLFIILSGLAALMPAALLAGIVSAFLVFRKPYSELPIMLVYVAFLSLCAYSLIGA